MELFRALVGIFVLVAGTLPTFRRMLAMRRYLGVGGAEAPAHPVSRVSGGIALLSGLSCFLFVLAVFALPVWGLLVWFLAAALLVWSTWAFVGMAPRLPWFTAGRRRAEVRGGVSELVFVLVALAAFGLVTVVE
ncbi:hypothetical protein [Brevibacterium litoralis]|uniref:hypothetical protein n=1 Tax=Brevibacterium litoralis TaxID=3138935 RepID=UPI0032EE80BB